MSLLHVISESGGKDSTATLCVALETQPRESLRVVAADTGNESQITYDYWDYLRDRLGITIDVVRNDFSEQIARKRRYVMEVWPTKGVPLAVCERAAAALVPSGNPFLDLCLWKGRFPSRMAQFCTQHLKTEPIVAYQLDLIDAGHTVWSWQGVRIDESGARRNRLGGTGACVKAFEEVGGGLFIYRPILRWTAADSIEAHACYGIEPNPLYRMGMSRVGCLPCIHTEKDEILQISKRFPEAIDRIETWEWCVGQASKRGISSFIPAPDDGRGDRVGRNIRQVVEWSKTSRGGVQYDLVRALTEPAACQSAYGLCE